MTERKLHEEKLRKSEERFRTTFEAAARAVEIGLVPSGGC